MTYERLAERVHLDFSIRLWRWSPICGAVWADSLYLTAWPLVSLVVPAAVVVFGLSVGAFHWLPMSIGTDGFSAYPPAVSFMQMLPLLVVAVAVSAFSSGFGFLLVVSYALGDLFISGATYYGRVYHVDTWWWLLHVTVPQLISYLLFLMLTVQPVLISRALGSSIPKILGVQGTARTAVTTLVAAALLAGFVYAWSLIAPMTIRPLWLWARGGSISPIDTFTFTSIVNPLLPLVAAGAALVRSLLVALAGHSDIVAGNRSKLEKQLALIYQTRKPRRLPAWLLALLLALVTTLLLAGMITRIWPEGLLVFAAIAAICLARAVVLPLWRPWRVWTEISERMPLIVRWLVVTIGVYLIGTAIVALPGQAVGQNHAVGSFGAELTGVIIGLMFAAAFFPGFAKAAPGEGTGIREKATVLKVFGMIAVGLVVMHPHLAWADCEAAHCCFVTNQTAALYIAAFALMVLPLLVFGSLVFGPEFLASVLGDGLGGLTEVYDLFDTNLEVARLAEEDDLAGLGAKAFGAASENELEHGATEAMHDLASDTARQIHGSIQEVANLESGHSSTPYPLGEAGSPTGVDAGSSGVPAGIGPLSPAQSNLPPHAVTQIGSAQGLQSSTTGTFSNVQYGQPGDIRTAYLWTIDGRGINIVPATASVPESDQTVVLTNLSTQAVSGGRLWFGPDHTVVLQLLQGHGFSFEHSLEQLQAVIEYWKSLGYTVTVQESAV